MNNYYKLIKVEPSANNNKLYILEKISNGYKASWGRVGSTMQSSVYSESQAYNKLDEKIRKGYVDITFNSSASNLELKHEDLNVENLFKFLIKNTKEFISSNFEVQNFTKLQIEQAQNVLNELIKNNKELFIKELLRIIPRPISNVKEYINDQLKNINKFILDEQNRIDSCSSSIIIEDVSNIFNDLDIKVTTAPKEEQSAVNNVLANGYDRYWKVDGIFKVLKNNSQKLFEENINSSKNQQTELLIHGTRVENVISILDKGLLIRPSNAYYSGSAYGDGIYHSLHMKKSMGYTGHGNEKILFIQNVHTGNKFEYDGWYKEGKSISRNDMSYNGLKKLGYDSLYVKAGDGLLNSEYIVYRPEQTTINYIVKLKNN